MPKMLNDGAVEYEDGTPATEAQVGLLTWLELAACSFIDMSYTTLFHYK